MASATQMLRVIQLAKSTAGHWLLHESRFCTSAAVLTAARSGEGVPHASLLETTEATGHRQSHKRRMPRFRPSFSRIALGMGGTALFIQMSGTGVHCAPEPVNGGETPTPAQAQAAARGIANDRNAPFGRDANVVLGMNFEELATQISLGSIAGFCSGYAVKKVSKVAAFSIGAVFIAVQVARFYGVISDVDWSHVERRLVDTLDTDGDGKLTAADVKNHFQRFMDVLGFNIPSGASFATFFILGLRYG